MVLGLFFSMVFGAGQKVCHAQETTINREYRIKAAYLFNFGRYTQWPKDCWPDKEAPFVIGVLGPNPFGTSLNQIAAEKQLQGRKILVRYFKDLSEYRPCQMLYIDKRVSQEEQKKAIKKLATKPVLIVGENYPFLEGGGMIAFFIEENKIPFGVNLVAMNRADLKLSSKVLKLAAVVKKDEEPPRTTSTSSR